MDKEVIVKYNGDIMRLESELGVGVEILNQMYAIITFTSVEQINKLITYPEIEYIEKPFTLEMQDTQSFSSTGITAFKSRTGLTGRGTILGVIDSGIDYTIPIFRDTNGNSKILYYWDQGGTENPPPGFKDGTLYTNSDIDRAIREGSGIPITQSALHGTHVTGICASIANEANIIFVSVGNRQTDIYSKSTEFMRAIKFILDRALELQMPVAINISYGTNEGSHMGASLFSNYINDMCLFWKNNIVIAAGNNGDKGGHARVHLSKDSPTEVEFVVGSNERVLNLNIWPNYVDNFRVGLITPSNAKSNMISLQSRLVENSFHGTNLSGFFYPIEPYSSARRISFQLTSNNQIESGIWRIVFEPVSVPYGQVDIYLPTSEGLNVNTRFLTPTKTLTVTSPGNADRAITVGSYNSRTDQVSVFSGEGDIGHWHVKPDLLAPGEGINSYLPGGNIGALSGTSMAAPHVTGVCSLLMQWGITDGNDPFMYSQRLKSVLIEQARRNSEINYPNDSMGYGKLDVSRLYLESIIATQVDGIGYFV
ncbi:MAG: S8 family serine peptidase [Clostridioides sp.]|jgi:subtilisin family serine protease|nr:S8 family serine peptidase [Clostridioides sp.]